MNMRNRVFILGAGGHAKVIAEIIQLQGHTLSGFLDDSETLIGQELLGLPILGPIANLTRVDFDGLVIGIGDNKNRYKIGGVFSEIEEAIWVEARHPSAVVSPDAQIGFGTMIVAGSIINIHTRIGSHCIVNTGATIDHDCVIHDYAHIGPGVHLAGSVTVGKGAFIATGANVIPGCTIGEWSIVGSGATVLSDVPPNTTVVGTPAQPLNNTGDSLGTINRA